jgi:UDP-N-acetyl-D-glucosamine dehydrogenase
VRKHDLKLSSTSLTEDLLQSMDTVVIITDHSSYDYGWIVKNAKLIIDTRNATGAITTAKHKIIKA